MAVTKEWKAAYDREYRARNLERRREQNRAYCAATRDRKAAYDREYRKKHKARLLAYDRERYPKEREARLEGRRKYYADNSGKCRALSQRRRGMRETATPAWADKIAMRTGYVVAAAFRKVGLPVEVDHEVPLVSDSVCGLHTHDNLSLVLRPHNRLKGNRYWPDMWESFDDPA